MKLERFLNRMREHRNSKDINIDEVMDIIENNRESVILDVRSPQEFGEGHLNRCNKYSTI